jgi:hypothetical protein
MVGAPFIHPLVGDVQYCGAEIEIACSVLLILLLFYCKFFFFHIVCNRTPKLDLVPWF